MYKSLFYLLLMIPFLLNAQLSHEKYTALKKELRPDKNEVWKSIPWKLSVLDAQKESVKSNKPIFIWAMDGHPLACV